MSSRADVMSRLHRINRKLFTVNKSEEKFFMGIGQINILKTIIDNESISQEELTTLLNLDKTTIAKAVKKLEANELIIRTRSQVDQRKKELTATAKAVELSKKMAKHLERKTELFFDGVTDSEIESFKITLEKIEANIENNRILAEGNRQLFMRAFRIIEKSKGLTVEKLAELLNEDIECAEDIVEGLMVKELIQETGGKLTVNQGSDHHSRLKGLEKKIEFIKLIADNPGITIDELSHRAEQRVEETEELICHLQDKGFLEVRDNKLYAGMEMIKRAHFSKGSKK